MKKLTILLILLIPIVFAFSPNEYFDGEDFRSRDINAEHFCSFLDAGRYGEFDEFFFKCVYIQRVSADNFTATPRISPVRINTTFTDQCVQRFGRARCINNVLKPIILREIRFFVSQLREDALRIQANSRQRQFLPEEFTITDEEINS